MIFGTKVTDGVASIGRFILLRSNLWVGVFKGETCRFSDFCVL